MLKFEVAGRRPRARAMWSACRTLPPVTWWALAAPGCVVAVGCAGDWAWDASSPPESGNAAV